MDHSSHVIFDQSGFMPHGHCYLWKPGLVWMHLLSDLAIGFAYVGISFLLYALVKKIRLPFGPLIIAFGVFIGACGLTHFMEVWTLWNPDYWASGMVKVVTAIASVATGLGLQRIRPKIIEFAQAARLSEGRRVRLESAHVELEALYEKVKEADILKTQFFANVSHELRTPLALILGPTEEVLRDTNLTAGHRHHLEVVQRNARTLLKQVNDLLDISKLEAGRMAPRYADVDVVKLFKYVVAHFETLMQTRHIFFALHAPETIRAQIDSDKIQRVYMNLLSNAIKFIPDGGRIRASIQSEGDNIVFTIEDNGPGIPLELRDVIFQRFRQGEGGVNRKVGGTGLGLAIVKDFVELHRGSVQLMTEHPHGAAFRITFPRLAPEGVQVARSSEGEPADSNAIIQGTLEELRHAQGLGRDLPSDVALK